MDSGLVVALGGARYRVDRPWGALPPDAGKVTDVAMGPDGRVFVLTRRDHTVEPERPCVHVLSAEGVHEAAWGGARIADAHMLACDAAGRVWVVDRDMHEVVAFDADGRERMTLGRRGRPGEPFNHPASIAFGPGGSIFVSEGYAGFRIHVFTPDGRPRAVWGRFGREPGAFLNPHGIWVTGDGQVWVADRENDRVQVFTPDGTLLAVHTGFHRPSDVWGDVAGNLFVCDAIPSLTMLTAAGTMVGRCRPVLNGAHGLYGTAGGDLLLAEGNPSRITRLRCVARA